MNKDKKPNRTDRNNKDPYDIFNRFFGNQFNRSSKDIFDLFEEQVRQMQQEMNNFNQYNNQQSDNKPRIYGWSYYMGPDGKPHYQEFSNTEDMPTMPQRSNQKTPELTTEKAEPFIDVIDGKKEIYITVELPGVDKENINVELNKDTLTLDVKHPERGFKKEVDLPADVTKKPVEAKYNNGVLSITLKKRKQKKKGNKINID
jgi:HSP20 family protein